MPHSFVLAIGKLLNHPRHRIRCTNFTISVFQGLPVLSAHVQEVLPAGFLQHLLCHRQI
jgi:hypothetical protein